MITLQKLSIADIEYNTRSTAKNLLNNNLMGSINALIIFLQNPQIDILTAIDIIENTTHLLDQMYDDHAALNAVTEVSKKDLENLNMTVNLDAKFQRLRRRNKQLKSIQEHYQIIFQKMIMSMNNEFKHYLMVLNTNLKHFGHLSTKEIHLFSHEDTKNICSIVPELLNLTIGTAGVYPRAEIVFQYLLTIPVSIVSNERSFSKLKIIKNYLRTNITDERLFYLMLCAIEKDYLDELNLYDLAKDWAKMKDRRIQLS